MGRLARRRLQGPVGTIPFAEARPARRGGDRALTSAKHRGARVPAHTDENVGRHYEDASLARGLASTYGAPTPLGAFYRERMARIAVLLEGVTGDLLDAGCGTGQMLRLLRDTRPGAFALTGLDRSSAIIDAARTVVGDDPSVKLVVGRLEEMPFTDASFDVVLAMGSLEYVTIVERAIGEIARVLRPGGLAICTMQNPRSPYRLWDAKVWGPVRRRRGGGESPIVHRLTMRALQEVLSAAGLEPQSLVRYGFNVLLPPLDTKLPKLAMGVQHRLERVARGPLRYLASDFLVVARREAGTATAPSAGAE